MDAAKWDSMRWDMFRWDVTRPDWDRLLSKLKNVEGDGNMVVDSGVVEVVADDTDMPYRVDVRIKLFDRLVKRFKKVS